MRRPQYLPGFFLASSSKFLGTSRSSFNNQHYLTSQFTSLASNSATNRFQIGYSRSPFTPQRWPSKLVVFTTSLHSISSATLCLRSAFLNLLSQPRVRTALVSLGFRLALFFGIFSNPHLRSIDSYTLPSNLI